MRVDRAEDAQCQEHLGGVWGCLKSKVANEGLAWDSLLKMFHNPAGDCYWVGGRSICLIRYIIKHDDDHLLWIILPALNSGWSNS